MTIPRFAVIMVLAATMLVPSCGAFVQDLRQTTSAWSRSQQQQQQLQQTTSTGTGLQAAGGGLFGDDGVLGNLLGGSSKQQGPKTVIEVPAKNVKIGALRFLLNIVLVSEGNKPEPKSWLTKQGEDAGDLQIYYKDGSGMLSVEMREYGITMRRHGEKPSLQYQLQESVLLHTILDELANVAFGVEGDDADIETEKRLLVLQDDNDIDKAREKLPARQA